MFGKLHRRDTILIAALAVVAILSLTASWFGGQKLEREILIRNATDEAVRWATYLEENFTDLNRVLSQGRVTDEDRAVIAVAEEAGAVFRYKMFDPNGVIVVASRPDDLGATNTKPYFSGIVQQGGTFTKLEEEESFGGDRQVVSEAYVPFMQGGRFQGAIEVYVDNTAAAEILHGNIRIAQLGLVGMLLVLGAVCAGVIVYNIRDRNRDYNAMAESNEALAKAEAEVRSLNGELEQRVEERTAEINQKGAQLNEANARISKLNEDLMKANSDLEKRIDARTADLERANEQLLRLTERYVGNGTPGLAAE